MIAPVGADPVPTPEPSAIRIFAPAGIGEVVAGTDLATAIVTATAADSLGPLRDGDIVVVTSKIISKAEGRIQPA
jgi:coenzyme F420-0:L-glutamate ligase/coenzyme F420-1:gamma-L-glutamate ligase